MSNISQREARRLRKENSQLLKMLMDQRSDWRGEWPEGTVICRLTQAPDAIRFCVATARRLHHAVVCAVQDKDVVFFGAELPRVRVK